MKILGLDLGSSSIGWALIEENSREIVDDTETPAPLPDKIIAIGSRIVPLADNEGDQFANGQALTKNAERTARRTMRKGYDRYQMRRAALVAELERLGMGGYAPTAQGKTDQRLELWGLRARAASERLTLPELSRVLLHINQKRGYRATKADYDNGGGKDDKKQAGYVEQIMSRYAELGGETVGQHLFGKLRENPAFRCKDLVYPRRAYEEEFDAIVERQRHFHPQVLTDKVVERLRNEIIFYQRGLRSCKRLVNRCELERHDKTVNGHVLNCGPRVAPRSSPLFQVCKIWESISNLRIENRKSGETLDISKEKRQKLFDHMNRNEKLTASALRKILGATSPDWKFGEAVGNGLQGNTTACQIAKALEGVPKSQADGLLRFNLTETDGNMVDTETGELTRKIDASYEREPLYRLWHVLYSVADEEQSRKTLRERFGIDDDEALRRLSRLDFVKSGYGNKSARAMCKLLPYLQEGKTLSEAKQEAGYKDTPPTLAENEARELKDAMEPLAKGALRQPVVEKVLNQMVNLVNALMATYGRIDEVRIEMARELQQSREERSKATKAIAENKKTNDAVAQRIESEYGLTPTKTRIQKYRMWEETDHACIYCGDNVSASDFLAGYGVEVEHIVPRSMLFDDSFSNKTCSCRKCNQAKGNRTAFDFMKSRGGDALRKYKERIESLGKKMSNAKKRKLLMAQEDLPQDFINRQLRESQYIARKAREMLQTVVRTVRTTTGSVTDLVRHQWGWDEVLHHDRMGRLKDIEGDQEARLAEGMTEMVERGSGDAAREVERIADWSKRVDHRHHAIDALAIACTKQSYIQRLNNLNSLRETSFRHYAGDEQGEKTRERLSRLHLYLRRQPHFSTAEVERAAAGILISFKSGKRVASLGKRYVRKGGKRVLAQEGVVVPRGALSEESVYGQIEIDGKREYVIRYKVDGLKAKDLESVVDKGIREILQRRLDECGGDAKKAFGGDVLDHQGRKIRSVRCRTGLEAVVPLRRNDDGEATAFVKPGNNHHVAIYEDREGKPREHVVTFWHAVERKKHGLDVVVTNPGRTWDSVTDEMPEEFKAQLPDAAWSFRFSMQRNEMFILGMSDDAFHDAMREGDYATLSRHLYRVQKLAKKEYCFRHHLETKVDDKYKGEKNQMLSKRRNALVVIQSMKAMTEKNPHKVSVDILGRIREA